MTSKLNHYPTVYKENATLAYSHYSFICISSDILRKFNPSLKGFSKGQGLLQKHFNMAEPGVKASYVHLSETNLSPTLFHFL